MLSPITSKRRWRRHIVYDLEWVPETYELRLVGVFDGKRYRCYRSIAEFLAAECTHKTRGRWFYAHAGGLADMTFLLQEFQSAGGWDVQCAFSGSSAIIVQVKKHKHSWVFCDSLWLLKDKLANIAKWLGTEKGVEGEIICLACWSARVTCGCAVSEFAKFEELNEEQRKAFYTHTDEWTLMEYNRQDCEILWRAVEQMQHVIWGNGGQLQKTLASSAMHLFRRRFLKTDIATSKFINDRAEQAYVGSRVEVFEEYAYNAYYLDINSSFPHSMTKPQPGNLIAWERTLPDDGETLYIADVEITVPNMEIPPIPVRLKNRIFFPTGRWRGWLDCADVELLQEAGGRIERVYEALWFEPIMDLAAYAEAFYQMRKEAKTPFEKTALKFLLNMLYGKFAEGEDKQVLHLDPEIIDASWPPDAMVAPGLWRYIKKVPVHHRHVPIATHITALSRAAIWRWMAKSEKVHYCDTDGFSSVTPFDTTTELGGLKLEKILIEGRFLMPKGYRIKGQELNSKGEWEDIDLIKLKGFSNVDDARWKELLEGRAIMHERMTRVREQAAFVDEFGVKGIFKPGSKIVPKKLQRSVLPKRFTFPDGSTRPWQYDELEAYFRGNRKW